jgi:hypothetical protein
MTARHEIAREQQRIKFTTIQRFGVSKERNLARCKRATRGEGALIAERLTRSLEVDERKEESK